MPNDSVCDVEGKLKAWAHDKCMLEYLSLLVAENMYEIPLFMNFELLMISKLYASFQNQSQTEVIQLTKIV